MRLRFSRLWRITKAELKPVRGVGMTAVFGVMFDGLVLFAWIFFVLGMWKYRDKYNSEREKDRNFQVKIFWMVFAGSILWFTVGVINLFSGYNFLLEFFLTYAFGHAAYNSNKKIKALRRK
jgi:hypothetical protein